VGFLFCPQAGPRWHVCAGDDAAQAVVAQVAEVMELPPGEDEGHPAQGQKAKRLIVVSNSTAPPRSSPDDVVFRLTTTPTGRKALFRGQVQLSLALAGALLPQGGLLLHGALAEWLGHGIVLVGVSGAGKTTASRRLPPPWRSLCDDTTLLMPNDQGLWRAHPWPTWSLRLEEEPCSRWNVPSSIPLRAIFHLRQAPNDVVESLGAGRALGRLVQSAEEASPLAGSGLTPEQARQVRRIRFEWLSTLVRVVPVFTLNLNRTGEFWREIENTLAMDTRLA
jgi:hypothetical protein